MMDKTSGSSSAGEESAVGNANHGTISGENSTGGTNPGILSGKDQYLKQLNKFSHKISKPPIRKPFDHLHPLPLGLEDKQPNQSQPANLQQQQQQHQPPVYNINKNDFRDVVQKLTGSPAHERVAVQAVAPPPPPPPPVHHHHQPKPQSSRLQRIRPPPLEHLSNRPPPLLNDAGVGVVLPPPNPSSSNNAPAVSGGFFGGQRHPHQPLSPLPPFPSVHAAAESPISAYLRTFQTSNTGVSGQSTLGSPRWNSVSQPPPPSQNTAAPPPTSTSLPPLNFPPPSSPLPFGCLPSPKSQFPMLSPGFPFSPTNQFGFQPFAPLSPTLPVPSPRWKGL